MAGSFLTTLFTHWPLAGLAAAGVTAQSRLWHLGKHRRRMGGEGIAPRVLNVGTRWKRASIFIPGTGWRSVLLRHAVTLDPTRQHGEKTNEGGTTWPGSMTSRYALTALV